MVGIMESKINYYIREVDNLVAGTFVPPITCEIDPSNKCMLDCDFCMFSSYLNDNNQDLEWDTYVEVLEGLRECGGMSVTFTGGGEPLMNKKFNSMADLAYSMGFDIGLVTNGVLLDKVTHPERFTFIRVSLDASDPNTYMKLKGKDLFPKVIDNIRGAMGKGANVGLSYVVCEANATGIRVAKNLAHILDVMYIQFKPAWQNGNQFTDYELELDKKVIETPRYEATDDLPCKIAGLIGIVGADSNVYYCCQFRGNPDFKTGSLKYDGTFLDLMEMRKHVQPDISKCPQCRYMNYAKAYTDIKENGTLFFKHKNFL
jgi:MoaA/NifB/PqqE/SkfB family radical SAM enzyme